MTSRPAPPHRCGPLVTLLTLAYLLALSPARAQSNGVMMQTFHWYLDGSEPLWQTLELEAQQLADAGFTALWLPPAYKGTSGSDVGYGAYDLYDLGEFNQKGSVATKYGTRQDYLDAIAAAHAAGLAVYADVVFNHKGGADSTEWVEAVRVESGNRNQEVGGNVWIDAWTRFDFPGRGTTYSPFKWRWYHFDGVDWAQNLQETGRIYKFRGLGKAWDWEVDGENGNYDYLMFADLDMDHPEVQTELESWGVWYTNTANLDGFRLDALKHIRFTFWNDWLDHVRNTTGKPLFTVGELWSYDVGKLHNFLTKTGGRLSLFDAPLHLSFYHASVSGGGFDLRTLMNGTLMKDQPAKAVTLVDNHDTQPLQALESPVADWFKPLAYAFILLREEGYPCVFHADYYGATYTDRGRDGNYHTINMVSHRTILDQLLEARRNFAWGPQYSYLDHWDVIGWTRLGNAQHPRAMAVILSDGAGGKKWMEVGKANATFSDLTGNRGERVITNEWGWGEFAVNAGSVSVWVQDPVAANQVSVYFNCANGTTVTGQDVYVVGSIPELGSWNPAQAIKLSPVNYPSWSAIVDGLPASTWVEWKCLKKQGGSVMWQGGANNYFSTPAAGALAANGSF
ncbi:MAG TPA: alpha-amylase [Thermoanaerobaculia bacterium]|nr:alpha-amylase [Thermoanaerobaculia bacterium]